MTDIAINNHAQNNRSTDGNVGRNEFDQIVVSLINAYEKLIRSR